MNSTVRYDSRQGAFAVKSGNKLVDLEIPANSGVVNISQTYIALNLSANYLMQWQQLLVLIQPQVYMPTE